jgi:hypothetical protein
MADNLASLRAMVVQAWVDGLYLDSSGTEFFEPVQSTPSTPPARPATTAAELDARMKTMTDALKESNTPPKPPQQT